MRVGLGFDRIIFLQLIDVGACNKRLLTRAGENCHADFRIVFDLRKHFTQLAHGLHVERVQDLGAVDGDVGDLIFLLDFNVFVGHLKPRRGLTQITRISHFSSLVLHLIRVDPCSSVAKITRHRIISILVIVKPPA
jgi:hypothetical protein